MTVLISGVRCTYHRDAIPAVSIDQLELTAGPVGLVGVNGAGKSTLLRTLAGCRQPQEGSVSIDGASLYGRRRRVVAQRVGYMPQEIQFPGELSVTQVVDYAAWLRALKPRHAAQRRADVIVAVGLEDRADQRVRALSGGMRRRLALAVALLSEPAVLLLDEPTTGLDPEQRAGVRAIIGEIAGRCLTIMSSHVMEDVASITSNVIVLHGGRVLHQGETDAFVRERGGPTQSAEVAFLTTIAGA
ncbi:ABC transporter ATP-binding protein [Nocardioides humilatus]|uniref:ABC transporter ATP-binding protein n=1 Tax=Nocardioides humilatus TaxID=2607660 RepID=UPI00165F524C|nr:ATP-binding cassette domain-containing protein [Nocardioides humilatus]